MLLELAVELPLTVVTVSELEELAESPKSFEESPLSTVGFISESFFALAVVSAGSLADTLDPLGCAVLDALEAALVALVVLPGSLTGCSCGLVIRLLAGDELVPSADLLRMKIFGLLGLLIDLYFVLAILTLRNYRNETLIGCVLRNI